MNLLLFTDEDRVGPTRIAVRDRRLQHLLRVLDTRVGDRLRVGELGGLMGEGEVLAITAEEATLEVRLDTPPPRRLPLSLVLALPRPKMLRRILRSVAEFGVEEIHLLNSYRVEKSYWQSPLLEKDTLRDYLLAGLAQCRDTLMPHVELHRRFKPFVEDALPGLIEGKRALLAHPGDYPPCPNQVSEPLLLVIGPEGGLTPYEVERLQEAGCAAVSMGPRILRVETAVSALLGRLCQLG